jgi:hypothetical protein
MGKQHTVVEVEDAEPAAIWSNETTPIGVAVWARLQLYNSGVRFGQPKDDA